MEGARLSALWVQGNAADARLWNTSDASLEAQVRAAEALRLEAVDLRLGGGVPLAEGCVALGLWGVQTVWLQGWGPLCANADRV